MLIFKKIFIPAHSAIHWLVPQVQVKVVWLCGQCYNLRCAAQGCLCLLPPSLEVF